MHLSHWLAVGSERLGALIPSLSLTYAAHALIWFALVSLFQRTALRPAVRSILWQGALVGPFLSMLVATHVTLFASERRTVDDTSPTHELTAHSESDADGKLRLPALSSPSGDLEARFSERAISLLCMSVLGSAVLGLMRWLVAATRLRRTLKRRRPVHAQHVRSLLRRLPSRFDTERLRLSESDDIASPQVVGRAEICVPAQLLQSLSHDALAAVLAHELAHLERRDPLWFLIASWVETVAWLVPTNRWAAARFRESAEHACDDRAAVLIGDRLSVARALTHVAAQLLSDQTSSLPAMASARRPVLERVRRLAASHSAPRGSVFTKPLLWIGLLGSLVLTANLSIRVARAGTAENAPNHRNEGTSAVALPSPESDALTVSLQVAELRLKAQALENELAELTKDGADGESAPVLQLQQELRHARENAAWLEQRFIE